MGLYKKSNGSRYPIPSVLQCLIASIIAILALLSCQLLTIVEFRREVPKHYHDVSSTTQQSDLQVFTDFTHKTQQKDSVERDDDESAAVQEEDSENTDPDDPINHRLDNLDQESYSQSNQTDSDPYSDQPWPRVALLMSFPNSGTSYTLGAVQIYSGYAVGTNYMKEHKHAFSTAETSLTNDTLIRSDSTRGPYWLATGKRHTADMKSYVLTKTHCGGYCNKCFPHQYILSLDRFSKFCRNDHKLHLRPYSQEIVSRAVRLIRDPLDNIISRFHHERATQRIVSLNYEDSRKDFHRYCKNRIDVYTSTNTLPEDTTNTTNFIPENVRLLFQGVPCHSDFLRYVQWHNLANQFLQRYRLPYRNVYYDDYETINGKWNRTMAQLMDFLHLDNDHHNSQDKVHVFQHGKTYHNYFYRGEIRKIWTLLHQVASGQTWSLLERYHHNNYPLTEGYNSFAYLCTKCGYF